MRTKKIFSILIPTLALSFIACSSSMMSFHSPVVKEPSEIKGAVIAGSTGSFEIQTIVGLGYNVDAGIKLSPFLPISLLDKQISYPLDVDLKYQILPAPFYLTAGAGWSSVINRLNTVKLKTLDKNKRWRLFLLFGTQRFYGGVQTNYFLEGTAFTIGRNPVYRFPTRQYFMNYIIGASLGKSLRINPEISFIHAAGAISTIWGMGLEFSGKFDF